MWSGHRLVRQGIQVSAISVWFHIRPAATKCLSDRLLKGCHRPEIHGSSFVFGVPFPEMIKCCRNAEVQKCSIVFVQKYKSAEL